ncbi:FAD-dependent oxidoreductase [Flavobacterium sp. HTF]|uniref:FAD-dependent oxidoreductase n=1 Tax=Flavobacterium sp. HTF TaxID=2170732 RepID=UPI000D5F66CB|nr:NAD(P)/FAD-dependent oxidoreductase [Flavobacterium sp. HTF]PWB22795.1 2-polyprenyl-6-methoxyphenol hydroxylase [Flavobacterium sp. HTF]
MDLLKNKTIAIIGGGPGGLTLARLLQRKGANVKVYERDYDSTVRVQGTRLDLNFDSGLKALQEANLMDAFKASYRADNERTRLVDQDAKVYLDYKEESTGDFGDQWFRPEIERGTLRTILLDSLRSGTVVWNSHIISAERIDDRFQLLFENGTTVNADIVIGADGANSKIRRFVTSIKPFYSGVSILQGSIANPEENAPKINDLFTDGKIMALGDSKSITVVSAKGSSTLDFGLSWKTNTDETDSKIDFNNRKDVLKWFKKEYSNWNPVWQQLFEAENITFTLRPQYCMPLDQKWETQPNITLIGDAAHLMPPFAGEGVNMAMLDALELSESLTSEKFRDLKSAIANYENQMLTRFSVIGKMTLNNTEWMHAEEGLDKMLSIKRKTINLE